MIVKRIKSRLPTEFVEAVTMMREQMGFPLDLTGDLSQIRIDFGTVREQSIEAGLSVEGVVKQTIFAPYTGGSHRVPLYFYRPESQAGPLPTLYWVHGGGLVVGSAEQDEYLLKKWVRDLGCVAVAVDYRLAPEFPFPTPLDDCYSGLELVVQNATDLKVDANRIVVGGASAGGGLAAALAQRVCDQGNLLVRHQLLLYPMLDCRNQSETTSDIDDTYIWSRENNHFGWKSYLGREPATAHLPKYASAMHRHDLSNLPPATILVGDIDLFAQECIRYSAKLSASGVPTELHLYPGGVHGFEDINPNARISKAFIATRDEALRNALRGALTV